MRESLRSAARDAALAAVRTLLGSVVRTFVFILCFLVLSVLLHLVTAGIDKVLDLPVLNALNTIGGGALGLIESTLLLSLVCDVAPRFGVKAFTEYEGTYLLSFYEPYPAQPVRCAVSLIFTPKEDIPCSRNFVPDVKEYRRCVHHPSGKRAERQRGPVPQVRQKSRTAAGGRDDAPNGHYR